MRVNRERLRADFEQLGEFGREPDGGGVTRPAFSEADVTARRWFADTARQAQLDVSVDALFNVVAGVGEGSAPAVWTGSHLDTVPHGGMFDGAVGAMAALECVRRLREEEMELARPVRAVAFSDEEGAFHGYLGSKGLVRNWSEDEMQQMTNGDGVKLLDALRGHGVQPSKATATALPAQCVHSFVELHIEQGPVLETSGTAIGVVSGIVGVRRGEVRFEGRADHAGTTPMHLRRDAARGAATFLDRLPEFPVRARRAGAVATCGRISLSPAAANVVPARATVQLDFRDVTTEGLDLLEEMIVVEAGACAVRHGLSAEYHRESTTPPARLDQTVAGVIGAAAERLGLATLELPSGAGHDAQVISALAPTGMIFVPSKDGRSHSAWEWTSWDDVASGADVLLETLLDLAGAKDVVG